LEKRKEINKTCYNKNKQKEVPREPSQQDAAVRKRKQRQNEKDKRERETERKRTYRQKLKEKNATTLGDLRGTFSNKMEKSRAVQKLKKSLPGTPTRRTAVMASYLNNKKSPTVVNLEKLNVVVTPEDKNDIQLSKAVMQDLREVVDQTKFLRSDGARTAVSIITASASGTNVENKKKKSMLAKKIGLPLKRISGGRKVRTQIFTSDESCFKYVQRKTRSDAISNDTKKLVHNFWLDPDNSRPSPNKNDIKRVRIAPKQFSKHTVHILDKTQTEIFNDFKVKYPDISMSQRTFERLKPFFVRAATPKDRVTCCCRYHVEAKSLFKTCMDFRKKYVIPELTEDERESFPVYEHLTDIATATLCEKDPSSNCFNKACLDRKCSSCGVRLVQFSEKELTDYPNSPTVHWECYEYITTKNKRKLTLVRKCTKPFEMFNYFRKVLDNFAGHQFRAFWQNSQLKCLKENLPQNHIIVIHDYSENYGCKEKIELQQTYFQRTEVSIHVSIIHRHAILELDGVESLPDDPFIVTEHFFVISPDDKHDQYFTSTVQSLIKEYLDSISYDINTIHEFTDGCPVQYKSRNCFGTISHICADHDYDLFIRNFFETSHAKGPQDAAGGFLKSQVDLAVLRGTTIVQNALDFYKYCEKNLKDTKSTFCFCRRRIFKYVDTINRDSDENYKPVPGIRRLHQVCALASTEESNKLNVRYLSCYSCDSCVIGNYASCTNNAIGDKESVSLKRVRNSDVDVESEDEEYSMTDLIHDGTLLALYTDDENAEYYLFHASSCPEIISEREIDDWGASFEKNSNIIRGLYFESFKTKSGLSYKLLKDKRAIVPSASVIYISPQLKLTRGVLKLSENVHLDILSILNEMEGCS